MSTVHDLLSRGYFPKELPPTFSTEDFADRVLGTIGPTPPSFADKRIRAHLCQHSFARVGSLRRQLGIPNPIAHYNLAVVIGRQWPRLERLIKRSKLSKSIPVPGDTRAFPLPSSDLVTLRAGHRATARYAVSTDISRFYHSVYTHSIPWAIHGKSKAKRNRSPRLLGNAIDFWVRSGQDGQTMGIPIGPDTSLILAEIILSAVDRQITRKLPGLRGFRFIDDYEFAFSTRHHADVALRHVQGAMAEFELALNSDKTILEELPSSLDPAWKTELRAFRFRTGIKAQHTDIVTYFDRAFAFAREYRGTSVLSYSIARLRPIQWATENWPLVESLLLQCMLAESGAFAPALLLIAQYHRSGEEINRAALGQTMNMQIAYHAPLGHGSEVAWALWACLSFQLNIVPSAGRAVALMNDSVVALLALHAREEGRFQRQLETSNWRTYLTAEDLWGPHWLLSYEAAVKRWLPSLSGHDHVGENESFAWLRDLGVEFYDRSRVLSVPAAGPIAGAPDTSLLQSLQHSVTLATGEYEDANGEGEEESSELGEQAVVGAELDALTRKADDDLPL